MCVHSAACKQFASYFKQQHNRYIWWYQLRQELTSQIFTGDSSIGVADE